MSDMLMSLGPLAWFISRAFGLVAYSALTLEVLLGLGASTGYWDRALGRARVMELHRWLSAIVLATFALHALALLADRTIEFSWIDLVLPFGAPYRPLAVGMGVIAGYALLTLHISHALRRTVGPRLWRRLHYVSFPAFVLASLHGILAGSDSGKLGFKAVYIGGALLVSGLTFLRLFQVVVARRAQAHAKPVAAIAR